ncbi:thiol-disulfide oxidoreductase DCC family protein [Halobaculum sp. MBLA0147]|uniref:thiol-disulfide oxidoreductase DCC family protein n=1 Tax=Halobaculum sp. MBLA0147 TaxID=3079934 RepID=UPI00352578DE
MTDDTDSVGGGSGAERGTSDEAGAAAVDAESVLAAVDGPILLFDGVCNLCNGTVRFVVDHDSTGRVSFAPLQSPVGRALLDHVGLPTDTLDSVVLLEGERYWRKSDAALRVARYLDAPLPAASVLEAVPEPIRNAAYDMVADHRYRVFGRKDRCPVPDPETRERFLDGSFPAE